MSEQQAFENLTVTRDSAFRTVTKRTGLKPEKAQAICKAFHEHNDAEMESLTSGKRLEAYSRMRTAEKAFYRVYG